LAVIVLPKCSLAKRGIVTHVPVFADLGPLTRIMVFRCFFRLHDCARLLGGLGLIGLATGPVAHAEDIAGLSRIQPPPLEIGVVTFPNGRAMSLSGGLGGGAFHDPALSDPLTYLVSDQGPALSCAESQAVIEMDEAALCEGHADAQIHPVPDFNPVITAIQIDQGRASIKSVMPITDRAGRPVTGLPNPLSVAATARAYGPEGQVLGLNPAGLDPEAIVRLADGRFLIGDGFGPSLALVTAKGMVEQRIVPTGLAEDVRGADYTVSEGLPGFLLKRPFGKGFSGLGLTADGSHALAFLSASIDPARPPTESGEMSVPVLLVDIASTATVGGMLYPLAASDRSISEVVGLTKDRFLVLEGSDSGLDLFEVTLPQTGFSALDATAGSTAKWPMIAKRRVGALSGSIWKGMRVGSAALLADQRLLIVADRDYGLRGQRTTIVTLDLSHSLAQ
jgi:hypothetical protein